MEKLLNEIDELLAHFEDFTHGKDGEDITKMRGRIALALRQYFVSGSLPLNEQSLIRWGFKMTGDGSFDRELNGVRMTLEYQVRFNNKIICDAPKTENQFEALFYGLTGLKLSGNDR